MKTKMYKRILLLLLVLSGVNLVSGQKPSDSLMMYLDIAVKNNPEVLQKYNEYMASLQKVSQVAGLPDPDINFGVFLKPMEVLSGNQISDIRLMQMIPWLGILKNEKDEMSLMAKANYESLKDAQLQVYYDVQRTWFELYKIQQNIRVFENNIAILHTIENLSLNKLKTNNNQVSALFVGNASNNNTPNNSSNTSGMNAMGQNSAINPSPSMQSTSPMGASSGSSALVDLYRIQIEMAELDNNRALLNNQKNTIAAQFNAYLNRPAQSPVSIADTLLPDTLNYSLQAIADSMLNNPMLRMVQYEKQSIEARKKRTTLMSYPMVGVGVNYTVINKGEMSTSPMNGKDMIMPMVSVTMPIYRTKYKAMQIETDYLKTASEQGYMNTLNLLQVEYYKAVQLYEDAQRRIKLYENQTLLAKKSLDIMIKSFSLSGANLTDILRVRQQMLDFEFKQIEAVVDYNTSIAWLNRLMANAVIQ